MILVLEFDKALSENIVKSFYDFSLIKLCSACAIKNTNNASSLLAKQTLYDLIREPPSSLIIDFEQVIKYFLV